MSALDQIVIAHHVLFAGHRLVVAQEVNGVHVAVIEMPSAIVEHLGNAMPQRPDRRDLQAGGAPQGGQGNGIVAAGVVAINVKNLNRVAEFVVVSG